MLPLLFIGEKFDITSGGLIGSTGKSQIYNSTLKTHKGEMIFYIDSETFEIINKFHTENGERILFADNSIIITYYKDKYITYDANSKNIIKEQKSDDIKNNGSYTFEVFENRIFIFNVDSGILINTIYIS